MDTQILSRATITCAGLTPSGGAGALRVSRLPEHAAHLVRDQAVASFRIMAISPKWK